MQPVISHSQSPRPASGDHKHACVSCYSRKVKCDRQEPCATCDKNGVECVYKDPAPPRRKKRMTESDLLERLNRYEDHLKRAGIAVNDSERDRYEQLQYQDRSVPSAVDYASRRPSEIKPVSPFDSKERRSSSIKAGPRNGPNCDDNAGALVTDSRGHTRYVESGLWVALHKEMPDPGRLVEEGGDSATDEEESGGPGTDPATLLFSEGHSQKVDLPSLYPNSKDAGVIWQWYVRNVVPIGRMVHVPTMQLAAQQAQVDPRSLPISKLGLMFSAFLMAITAMENNDCLKHLQQSRKVLLKHFRYCTHHALLKAHFLRSADPEVLSTYVHYLLAMRLDLDSHTLWALTGVAFRIARRIGLHKDGSHLGLSPFETEMRRRLWFQLSVLDYTSAELAGLAPELALVETGQFDTLRPSNLNDSDLDPNMKELPPERVGATEMIFQLLRYHFKDFFKTTGMKSIGQTNASNNAMTIEEKDRIIDCLEKSLEEKILRFCDPLDPLHYLTSIAARTALSAMRLRAHHPRQYADGGASLPQSEKDMLFELSMKIMSYYHLAHETPFLKGFLWHSRVYFQWHSLIYMLTELRHRKLGPEVDKAWDQIEGIYENLGTVMLSPRHVLYSAIISLTIKAWEAREAALRSQQIPYTVPEYIRSMQGLEAQRKLSSMRHHRTQPPPQFSQKRQLPPPVAAQTTGPAPFWTNIMDTNLSNVSAPYVSSSGTATTPIGTGTGTGSTPGSVFSEPAPTDWAQWEDLLRGTEMMPVLDFDTAFWQTPGFS